MKNIISISVIIGFRGREHVKQLKKCVDSLLLQSHKPKDIILVGSRNDLSNYYTSLSNKEKKLVKTIYISVGKNVARNIGINNAKSDYVLIVDHDMVADKNLLQELSRKASNDKAIVIPEKFRGKGFWNNCKKLEKDLRRFDPDTITPRFFYKHVFGSREEPFSMNYGLLDEWGLRLNLSKKNVKIDIVKSFFTINANDFSLSKDIKNKFFRGVWLNNFVLADKTEAWSRVNPLKRGLIFYLKNIKYFYQKPLTFFGMTFLKTIHLLSFFAGYFIGKINKDYFVQNYKKDVENNYDDLSEGYLKEMFLSGRWNKHIDLKEKEMVAKLLKLNNFNSTFNKTIIDVGTGPGRWSKYFLNFSFKKVIGIDVSKVMIESSKKRIKDKRFSAFISEAENINFPDEFFDIVFCFRTFKYVQRPEDAISEFERICKNGGIIIVEITNNNILNFLIKRIALVVTFFSHFKRSSKWRYFSNAKFYSVKDFLKLINSTKNLQVKKKEPLFILPSINYPTFFDKNFAGLMIFCEKLLFKLLPKNLFARSWIYVIMKK